MSIRKQTANRFALIRICHTCGKVITTTADTPWVRQLCNVDGKKQKTCYFCSEACKRASYQYSGWWDGLTEVRRAAKEAARAKEKNRRYYAAHAEQERQRARARYWRDPEEAKANAAYQRRRRRAETA